MSIKDKTDDKSSDSVSIAAFSDERKAGVYEAIYQRRDMRHFRSESLPQDLVDRLLKVAHAAPSVGLMQPWRILQIESSDLREQVHQLVEQERLETARALGKRSEDFMQLKVQGILECPQLWVISLMDQRQRHIFGRRTLPQMDLASASCAIQNIWLAARAEGIGVGWVSIFDPQKLQALLGMPEDAEPIAILCIGYVNEFYDEPLLIQEGWAERGNLEDYVMTDRWDADKAQRSQQQWDHADASSAGDPLSQQPSEEQ